MGFKEKIAGLDEVSEFVDENEHNLRRIIPEIIEEECIKDRITEKQEKILRMYYIENKIHSEIAEKLELETEDVLEEEDRAFKGILIFADICGLNSLFEDDLLGKLRTGDEAIKRTMKELEKEKVFTKEELEIINNSFYVLKGINEKNFSNKTLMKAQRLFFARYKPPKF